MKANNDKHLEKLVDRMMKETSLETPSAGFTSKLMSQVMATEISKATVYKPLISRRSWFIICAGIISLLAYFINIADAQAGSRFQDFDLSSKMDALLKSLPSFKISDIASYAVGLLIAMLFIQITLLKNYFNKRLQA